VGREWLEACLRDHPQCAAAQPNQHSLPTRVIDVGSLSQNPSLFITKGAIGSWTALTYCWGGASEFTLTNATLRHLQNGDFPLSAFPSTLRDAILITRALNVKYLWIDALCILQDSKEDWSTEAPQMGDIYRNALVTIAVPVAPCVTTGILGPRKRHRACTLRWKSPRPSTSDHTSLDDPDLLKHKLHEQSIHLSLHRIPWEGARCGNISEWAGRGWTMQEEFMASRILFYTSLDMTWDCGFGPKREGEPRARGAPVRHDYTVHKSQDTKSTLREFAVRRSVTSAEDFPATREEVADQIENKEHNKYSYSFWYGMVWQYTKRSLSHPEDRLPAIGALARFIHAQVEDEYCAGLWKRDLVKGLLWRGTVKEPLPGKYIAPSWSWVSGRAGQVRWVLEEGHTYEELAFIDDVNLRYDVAADPFGRLTGGTVTLTAPHRHLRAIAGPEDYRDEVPLTKFEEFIRHYLKHSYDSEFPHKHIACPNQSFAALQMATAIDSETKKPFMELLLVESANDHLSVSREPDHETLFRRIGKVSLRRTNTPDPEPQQNYWNPGPIGVVENAAWCEVAEQEWPVRKFTII
jgi:hypothetical protein